MFLFVIHIIHKEYRISAYAMYKLNTRNIFNASGPKLILFKMDRAWLIPISYNNIITSNSVCYWGTQSWGVRGSHGVCSQPFVQSVERFHRPHRLPPKIFDKINIQTIINKIKNVFTLIKRGKYNFQTLQTFHVIKLYSETLRIINLHS